MLKAVKHLSMNSNLLEVLQNANAIEILIRLLDEDRAGPHGTVGPPSDVRVLLYMLYLLGDIQLHLPNVLQPV